MNGDLVNDVIVETLTELGIPKEQITGHSHLQSDLELDSTETVQLSLEMKRQFGVDVKLESGTDLTVGAVCELVVQAMTV